MAIWQTIAYHTHGAPLQRLHVAVAPTGPPSRAT
eukprot:SAG25_NODE_3786_length_971_cov_291.295872_1_plen_33_part_10